VAEQSIESLREEAERLRVEDRWDREAERVNRRLLELAPADQPAAVRLSRCIEATDRERASELLRPLADSNPVARSRLERLQRAEQARERARGCATPRARGQRGQRVPVGGLAAAC